MEPENKVDKINSLIIKTLDWRPLMGFGSRNSRKAAEETALHGSCGVYLVSTKENLTDDIINANIGYVGESYSIFYRIYDMKGGKHGVRKYLKSKSIDPNDVYVKLLLTEEGFDADRKSVKLEKLIHEEHVNQFGYRFSWKEASEGNDGATTRIMSEIDKLEDEDDLRSIYDYIEEKAVNLYRANWRNR